MGGVQGAGVQSRVHSARCRKPTNPMREARLPHRRWLLDSQHLHNHTFPSLPVELGIEDPLPGSQVQLAVGHRKGGLVMQQQRLQMRVAVGFAGAVMLVVGPRRCQLLQPDADILDQPALQVVHVHRCRNVHGRNEAQTVPHAAPLHHSLDLVCDVHHPAAFLSQRQITPYGLFSFPPETKKLREMVHITDEVERVVERSGVRDGCASFRPCTLRPAVYVKRPGGRADRGYRRLAGEAGTGRPDYKHHRTGETNGDAHLKSLLPASRDHLPVTNGKLRPGNLAAVFYAEFDGQRRKRVIVKVLGVE